MNKPSASTIGALLVFGANPVMAYIAGRLWDQEPTLVLLPLLSSLFLVWIAAGSVSTNAK